MKPASVDPKVEGFWQRFRKDGASVRFSNEPGIVYEVSGAEDPHRFRRKPRESWKAFRARLAVELKF